MASCDGVAAIPALLYPASMTLARAHALSAHGPAYALILTGIVHGTHVLCAPCYSLQPSVRASAEDYERTTDLRDSLARHSLELTAILDEVSVIVVPRANGLGMRADARAWSDLLRRRPSARVEWQGLDEIQSVLRAWLNVLN